MRALAPADPLLKEVELILQTTGVVAGEFGFVGVYRRKKQEMADWLTDVDPDVRAFAESYVRTLDRPIAAEQRRSEEDIEIRRRMYDDPDDPKAHFRLHGVERLRGQSFSQAAHRALQALSRSGNAAYRAANLLGALCASRMPPVSGPSGRPDRGTLRTGADTGQAAAVIVGVLFPGWSAQGALHGRG